MGKHHKKRKRADSDSSSESDEGREVREETRKHKKEKKGKSEKKEKSEKKLLKDAKRFLKQRLKGDATSKEDLPLDAQEQIEEISSDSYFQKNPEFTAWLRNERSVFFNDLPTADARVLFEQFVHAWNARQLPRKYYDGMTPTEARRTQHHWGLRGKSAEDVKLGMEAALEEEREAQREHRDAQVSSQRRWRADQKLLLDEMLPKATGRDAQIEKRAARREDARARDASPELTTLPGGGDIYGGGDDSFAAAKIREGQRQAWRDKERAQKSELATAKLRDAQAKEDERMAQFRALAAQGPIAIAKRQ